MFGRSSDRVVPTAIDPTSDVELLDVRASGRSGVFVRALLCRQVLGLAFEHLGESVVHMKRFLHIHISPKQTTPSLQLKPCLEHNALCSARA